MNTGFRVMNTIVMVFLAVMVLNVAHDEADFATVVATAIGASLWILGPALAFRALGMHATARLRKVALWVNLIEVLGLAAFAVGGAAEEGLFVTVFVAIITAPFLANVFRLQRILKTDGGAPSATHATTVASLAPAAADPAVISELAARTVTQAAPNHTPPETASSEFTAAGDRGDDPQSRFITESTTRTGVLPADPASTSNYVARHWRGDLALPVSYWVNGSLLGVAFAVLFTVATLTLENYSVRTGATVNLVLLLFLVAATVWSSVGIWRSAENHPNRGGSPGWATAAKVMTALGLLSFASALIKNIGPQLKENFLIASGYDPLGRIEATVSTNGHAIILKGMFGAGSADHVRGILDAAPGVRTVVLESNGGRLGEAEQVARFVRDRKLDTYVESTCASACTYVFLAGADRAATPNATLGFHSPTFPGLDVEGQAAATQQMLNVYRIAGIPQSFLERVRATANHDMWYPTRDELIDAGVINRISLGGETSATSTLLYRSKQELALALRSMALMQAFDTRFPGTLARAVDAAWQAHETGASDADFNSAARAIVSQHLTDLLAAADDDALQAYVDLTNEQIVAAREVGVEACGKLLSGTLNVQQVLPKELVEREAAWMLQVIKTAGPKPRAPVDAQMFGAHFQLVLSLMSEDAQAVIADFEAYAQQPRLQCEAMIELYENLRGLPDNSRRIVMRGMWQKDN